MTTRVPYEIREEVLTLWLRVFSRDDIAKVIGIGAGTVSEIVKNYRQRNPGFELVREFVVAVKKDGSNIKELASAIRLRRMLKNNNLVEEQIESLIGKVANHCFKKKVNIWRFIENVDKVTDLSDGLNIDLVKLPDYIGEKKSEIDWLNRELLKKQNEFNRVLKEYNIVQMQLSEFRSNVAVVEEMQKVKSMLEKTTKERDVALRAIEILLH
ncbi:MAG: hypothetical protein M3297_08740 [Thermoproteota archaeon]|nr:hypothetical protein [Thermoproteota archaeon]